MYGNGYIDSALVTERKLKSLYLQARHSIIKFQNIVTGLFVSPNEQEQANLRDCLFCCYTLWALSEGYKRFDCSNGLEHELANSAIKGMRGILSCWMQQSSLVEEFKKHQSIANAFNSTFHPHTGMPLDSSDMKDRQIHVTALFLIFLTQMITSGRQLIYSKTEVNFIQNLVFCIERAYRTPDNRVWQRDNKPRTHPCTIGIVKAALECTNGFNLYGPGGPPSCVLYVDVDAHNRNSVVMETLLDFHINDFDIEVILALGWPCFATHKTQILADVVERVSSTLSSPESYDGDQYMTYCLLMMINGIFWRNDQLRGDFNGGVDNSISLSEDETVGQSFAFYGTNLMTNSLHLFYCFLSGRIIHRSDSDPIRRYLPGSKRPRRYGRHTNFQGLQANMVIQVVQIAESKSLQSLLLDYGIQSQTPSDIYPIEIWNSKEIVRLFENLGVDAGLHLSGRPQRPFGFLSSSKVYKICGKTVICFPHMFNVDFYLWHDTEYVMSVVQHTLRNIERCWKLGNRPMFGFLIYEYMMRGANSGICLDLLSKIKNGVVDGVRVVASRVQNLMSHTAIEHIDFVTNIESVVRFQEVDRDEPFFYCSPTRCGTLSLSETDYQAQTTEDLKEIVKNKDKSLIDRAYALNELTKRSSHLHVDVEKLYQAALRVQNWRAARLCSCLTHKSIHSLSPLVTTIISYGKTLIFGVYGHREVCVNEPSSHNQLIHMIYDLCMPHNPIHVILHQEVLYNLGILISSDPDALKDIFTIRIGAFIHAIEKELLHQSKRDKLEDLSPSKVNKLLKAIVCRLPEDRYELCADHYSDNGHRRMMNGLLGRLPAEFLSGVKKILRTVKSGVLFQGATISGNVEYINLNLFIVKSLDKVRDPIYQQIIIEALTVILSLVPGLTNLSIDGPLDIDLIIECALDLYNSGRNVGKSDLFAQFSNLPLHGNWGTGSFLVRSLLILLSSYNVGYVKSE